MIATALHYIAIVIKHLSVMVKNLCFVIFSANFDWIRRKDLKTKLPSEYFETGENLYISNTVKTLLETAFYVRHTSTRG